MVLNLPQSQKRFGLKPFNDSCPDDEMCHDSDDLCQQSRKQTAAFACLCSRSYDSQQMLAEHLPAGPGFHRGAAAAFTLPPAGRKNHIAAVLLTPGHRTLRSRL